ncbi:MAG: Flp pilus assembly protein CpaB [Blastocatellia bacterium]
MNRRFLLALAISAFFGLLAILIFRTILQKSILNEKNTRPQVVFATTKIPVGTVLTTSHVHAEPYLSAVPEGAFSSTADVIGKVAQVELDANVPIQAKQITTKDRLGPGYIVRKDYRAMSIRVDEASSVTGFASPGSIVDVVAVVTPGANSKPVSKVILQNLRVLANGQQTQARAEGQGRIGNTVTLEVTPAQAEILTLAGREGTLHLLLRHPADDSYVDVRPVVMPSFVESYPQEKTTPAPSSVPKEPRSLAPIPVQTGTPPPTPSPAMKMSQVRVIAGDKVETVSVRQ